MSLTNYPWFMVQGTSKVAHIRNPADTLAPLCGQRGRRYGWRMRWIPVLPVCARCAKAAQIRVRLWSDLAEGRKP